LTVFFSAFLETAVAVFTAERFKLAVVKAAAAATAAVTAAAAITVAVSESSADKAEPEQVTNIASSKHDV